jgi:ApaG protein
MHGTYFCVAEDGARFDAEIAMFVLDAHSHGTGTARVLH